MSEEIKKIIEGSRTEEELLENLDKVGHRLSDDELEAVAGGSGCGNNIKVVCGQLHADYPGC